VTHDLWLLGLKDVRQPRVPNVDHIKVRVGMDVLQPPPTPFPKAVND
jgi:hypothetical protein